LPRHTKKPSISEAITKPTLQALSPRDALAVELALEWVRNKGSIRTDVANGLVEVADFMSQALGWTKAKKSARQVAEETLEGHIENDPNEFGQADPE
jgi:hypothetical protein